MATPTLSDDDFIRLFEECGRNSGELARRVGVSRQAVSQRLKRLQSQIAQRAAPRRAAVAIKADVSATVAQEIESVKGAFQQVVALKKMDAIYNHVEKALGSLLNEVEQNQSGRFKPFQLKQMTSLARECRGFLTDIFKMKKDLLDMQAVAAIIDAMVEVFTEYDADFQDKLFAKLSRIGLSEQAAAFNPEPRSPD